MDVKIKEPPRPFRPVAGREPRLLDCGTIELAPDEQVTLVTGSGAGYDVVRKSWGFYATPSLESRLPRHGMRAALVRNAAGRHFVVLVEDARRDDFDAYCAREGLEVATWLSGNAKRPAPAAGGGIQGT